MKGSSTSYRAVLAVYLRPLWPAVTGLLVLLLLGTGLKLLNPQILALFIDGVVGGHSPAALTRLALLFLGVAVLTQILSVVETYLATHIGLAATNQLRADLALHCLQLDMGFHNSRTPGELIERVDGDVGELSNFFARFAVDLLGNGLLLVGAFAALFRVDWRVGLALSLFALVTLLLITRLRSVAVSRFREARQAGAALFGFLEERLLGTEDVRSSGATAYVMGRFYEHTRLLFRKGLSAQMVATTAFGISNVMLMLGSVLALGLGAYFFLSGLITIGAVYLIYRYMELLTEPIERINRQIQDLQRAGAAIIRIQDLLNTHSQIRDEGQQTLPDGPLAINFEGINFAYAGQPQNGSDLRLVLRDIVLSLSPGTTLGLLGRTGSGKTTLTRLLFRFYEPSQGTIRLGGVALPQVRLDSLRRRVGLVTQEIQLFHATVRENLTLFDPAISDERILAVIEQLGLWGWFQSLPDGLETTLAPGGGLSAGEGQLLAFVRVFLKDPGLIILDEASSRLDPTTEQHLETAIGQLLAGRTAIIIAHRLATVQRVDQIMILENGRCLEYGPRAQLAANLDSRFAQLLKAGLEDTLL